MSINPGRFDEFVIHRGETFDWTLTLKAAGVLVDLTGYTAAMSAKVNLDDTVDVFSLTSGDGLTVGGSAGTIRIVIDPDATALIPYGTLVYDLQLTSGLGSVSYLIEGVITVQTMVT